MIHIRIDNNEQNSNAVFACGIIGTRNLPYDDTYLFESEVSSFHRADCQGCNPGGPHPYGTPISQLSGRPRTEGYADFKRIADSWGHP